MLSRDLFASVIKTFFEELEDVRDGGKQVGNESLYAGFYTSYFTRDRTWFLEAPVSEITAFLIDDPIRKLEMLTELMYRDAYSLSDLNMQKIIYQKILGLYEVIDVRSMEYSVERMNRVVELKELLQ